MADHLPLRRLERIEPRRKPPAPLRPPARVPGAHGRRIEGELDIAVAAVAQHQRIEGIDPALILKVQMSNQLAEEDWRNAGFHTLAQEPGNILVLFSSSLELNNFRQRLAQYQAGAPADRRNPAHNRLFANIEHISDLHPADRIGPRFKEIEHIRDPDAIDGRRSFIVDVELWDAATAHERQNRVLRLSEHIAAHNGEVLSSYVGTAGLVLLRARVSGTLLKSLLNVEVVALIDLPPVPDLGERDPPDLPVEEAGILTPPAENAPLIGIIDSGMSDHPLLAGVLQGRFGVPAALGDADAWGHGTRVGSVAAYGDIRECIDTRTFSAPARLISAKVTNDEGRFDDGRTVADQMDAAIRELHRRGCRVINISLGDGSKIAYDGGRLSTWAATIDALAKELDIVIVISAGNPKTGAGAPWGDDPEGITRAYPNYLVLPENRIIDPATAACALTVGSLAHGNGLRRDDGDGAEVRAITERDDASPRTRCGPGTADAIKPELCDYGGTLVYDGGVGRILSGRDWASAGMLSFRSDYLRGLFTSTDGTSIAAARVTFKAALLARKFPNASANLLRALLATCAEHPAAAKQRLDQVGRDTARLCLGYGMPDVERALESDDRHVILYADRQELTIDDFALFEVWLPDDFRRVRGERQIRVTLAFDPPVKHTRMEYLGVRMNFHLMRGLTPDQIFEFFKRRPKGQAIPEIPGSSKCGMEPGSDARSSGTLQSATFCASRSLERYAEIFYVAVFANRRWAGEEILRQKFSLIVELKHEGEVRLYQPLRQRVRL